MIISLLPDGASIARYTKGINHEDGKLLPAAFSLRADDNDNLVERELSAFWLQYIFSAFETADKISCQLDALRSYLVGSRFKEMKYSSTWKVGVLFADDLKRLPPEVLNLIRAIEFHHDPRSECVLCYTAGGDYVRKDGVLDIVNGSVDPHSCIRTVPAMAPLDLHVRHFLAKIVRHVEPAVLPK